MRILHIPYSYYPDPVGGTEVYVNTLAKWQLSFGCDVAVAAPGAVADRYKHEGVPVWRFAGSPSHTMRTLYGEGDTVAASEVGAILDDWAPEILHIHALTVGVSVRLADEAAKRGIKVIFNYHTPTVSCPRGTLRWGQEVCDGDLQKRPCVACTLHGCGVPRQAAQLLSHIPVAVSRQFGRGERTGGMWTALRMPELVGVRIEAFHRLMRGVDRVVALCDWTRELLIRNNVPADKIAMCRQGISWTPAAHPPEVTPHKALRVAFLGRLDETKGVHLIVEALTDRPELPVELDLFGVRQGESGNRYAARIQELIAKDKRIRVMGAIPSEEVVPRLSEYDLLAVPSQWLETGPLVVLEAFAAGVPVLGSDLGGIAELVKHGVNGLLVNPSHLSSAWADSFRQICDDRDLLASLRHGIQPPRTMRQVAVEMMELYRSVVPANRIPVSQ